MPFSWKTKKKTRRNRFSQLVADHLQSPKRGGSLVVETGFPTSLIDLYVRNRGRFRKKQRDDDSPSPSSPSSHTSSLMVDSSNVCSSLSLYPLVDSNIISSAGLDHRGTDEIIEEDVVVGGSMVVSETEITSCTKTEVEMAKLNPVSVVMLMVLFIMVLVLGTKRFTIGITMSAFLLLLLELVGKLLLRRWSKLSFHEIENIKSSKENRSRGVCSQVLEIEEEVESKQEVRSEKELDEARSEVLMEIKHKSSRRAAMKSKMKKLVPKKLRKSSMGTKDEISYRVFEEETVKSAQDHKTLVFSSECSDSKGETLRILKQNQDKIVEIEGRSLSPALSSEIDCNGKELGRELHQNSGFLVLCLIVLVGLIGGRALAVALALSWCLIVKKLQWRNYLNTFLKWLIR
ncbi:hypothetical protein HanIR_Chr08g0390121 [Helianthus annuus]|nr:hypothetical protein HanIR_Chr08g0390121 [Helianthus annuus]